MNTTNIQDRKWQVSRILTLGTAALVEHIEAHNLPFPDEIRPDLTNGVPTLIVHLDDVDHPEWVASVCVDSTVDEVGVRRADRVHTTWDVRLPDTGTRVQLRCIRAVPFEPAYVAYLGRCDTCAVTQ